MMGSGNILSRRLIMKYFLWLFSPFCGFKKGSCLFLLKECAQVLVKHLRGVSLELWLGKLTAQHDPRGLAGL